MIIDAQVHAYERNRPERPWVGRLAGPAEVTGDAMVRAMDDVGVDGAILVSPWTMYRYDASYALDVQRAHPGRFALVRPFDPEASDIHAQLADWAAQPGAVGARLMLARGGPLGADHRGVAAIATEAGRLGLPLNVLCWGMLDVTDQLAAEHPETRIVIDHLGLQQPFHPPAPPEPWAELPRVLELARHPNVAIKVSGACTLSHEPFPYADIWEPLGRLFDAYGIDRCMWGTDWTRATHLLTYRQAVEAFTLGDRLSDDERARLMGGTLTEVYGWAPDPAG